MDIEQIKDELSLIEGKLLQLAIDETDGSYGAIKGYVRGLIEESLENENNVLYALCMEALDTLEWSILDVKPFN